MAGIIYAAAMGAVEADIWLMQGTVLFGVAACIAETLVALRRPWGAWIALSPLAVAALLVAWRVIGGPMGGSYYTPTGSIVNQISKRSQDAEATYIPLMMATGVGTIITALVAARVAPWRALLTATPSLILHGLRFMPTPARVTPTPTQTPTATPTPTRTPSPTPTMPAVWPYTG